MEKWPMLEQVHEGPVAAGVPAQYTGPFYKQRVVENRVEVVFDHGAAAKADATV